MSSDEDDIVFKKKGKKDKVKSTDDGTSKPKKVDQFLNFDDEEPIAFVPRPKKEKKISKEDKESDSRAKLRARLLAAEGDEEPHAEPPVPVYKPVAHQPRDSTFGTDTFDPFAMAADDYDGGATNTIGTTSLASKYGASAGVIYGSRTVPLDANSNAESSLKLDGSFDISDNISGMAGITLTLAEIEAGKGAHLGLEGDMEEASDENAATAARSQAARMIRAKTRGGQGVDMSAFTEEEAAEWHREEAREQAEVRLSRNTWTSRELWICSWMDSGPSCILCESLCLRNQQSYVYSCIASILILSLSYSWPTTTRRLSTRPSTTATGRTLSRSDLRMRQHPRHKNGKK